MFSGNRERVLGSEWVKKDPLDPETFPKFWNRLIKDKTLSEAKCKPFHKAIKSTNMRVQALGSRQSGQNLVEYCYIYV